jgi:hypothetical protein
MTITNAGFLIPYIIIQLVALKATLVVLTHSLELGEANRGRHRHSTLLLAATGCHFLGISLHNSLAAIAAIFC